MPSEETALAIKVNPTTMAMPQKLALSLSRKDLSVELVSAGVVLLVSPAVLWI